MKLIILLFCILFVVMAIYGIIIMNNTDEKIAESECRIKSEIWDATHHVDTIVTGDSRELLQVNTDLNGNTVSIYSRPTRCQIHINKSKSIYPPLNSVKQCMKCGDDITDSIFRFHMEYIAATDDTKEHILKKCSKCKGYWKEDVYRGDK